MRPPVALNDGAASLNVPQSDARRSGIDPQQRYRFVLQSLTGLNGLLVLNLLCGRWAGIASTAPRLRALATRHLRVPPWRLAGICSATCSRCIYSVRMRALLGTSASPSITSLRGRGGAAQMIVMQPWTRARPQRSGPRGHLRDPALYGMAFPHRTMLLLFLPIPMPAWLFVTLYGILELSWA